MKKDVPIYKLAPVTASTAEFLARVYGASGIDDYVKTLPHSANILDVGAGNSELGRVVAKLRPDITWTNFDIDYTADRLNRLRPGAPKNLRLLNGDILNPSELQKGSYDRVYAFWVLPHLGLEDPKLVRIAMGNMLKLLKDTSSILSVGPLVAKRTKQASSKYLTATLGKEVSEAELSNIVSDCTVPKDRVAFFRALNRSGLSSFKSKDRTGQNPTKLGLWDAHREQYVKAFSIRGLFLMASFRIHLMREKLRSS